MQIYSRRGQFMVILLASLEDLRGRVLTKREVEAHIERRRYLILTPELLEFYASKQEPMWKTELAQARRDPIERGYLKNPIRRDAWEIAQAGLERLLKAREALASGSLDAARFGYWSLEFFRRMGVNK